MDGADEETAVQDFLQILEEHRRNCERQGKYVEAEIAKNRIEELRRQYPLNYFHVSPLSFCFDFAACHPFQPCVWLRTSGSTLLTCRIQLGNTFSVFFFLNLFAFAFDLVRSCVAVQKGRRGRVEDCQCSLSACVCNLHLILERKLFTP